MASPSFEAEPDDLDRPRARTSCAAPGHHEGPVEGGLRRKASARSARASGTAAGRAACGRASTPDGIRGLMIWVNRPTSPDAMVFMATNGESLTGAGAPSPERDPYREDGGEAWCRWPLFIRLRPSEAGMQERCWIGTAELPPMTVNALIAARLVTRDRAFRTVGGLTASYVVSPAGQAALAVP